MGHVTRVFSFIDKGGWCAALPACKQNVRMIFLLSWAPKILGVSSSFFQQNIDPVALTAALVSGMQGYITKVQRGAGVRQQAADMMFQTRIAISSTFDKSGPADNRFGGPIV